MVKMEPFTIIGICGRVLNTPLTKPTKKPSGTGIYMFNVNDRNTRTICSKLTIKTPKQRHGRCSGVFSVSFEHISLLVPVFLLLTLNT